MLNEKTLRVTPDPHTALSILYSVYTNIHEYTKVCQIYERLTNILYICGIHTNVSTYKYILVSSLILGLSCMIALYDLGTHSKKNYGIIWEFFPSGGPPPPFWEPLIRKKIIVYFAF